MYTRALHTQRFAITHSSGTVTSVWSAPGLLTGVRVNGPRVHDEGVRVNREGVRVN